MYDNGPQSLARFYLRYYGVSMVETQTVPKIAQLQRSRVGADAMAVAPHENDCVEEKSLCLMFA